MIRRPPRSTLSSSSAASDVYKRQFFDTSSYPYGNVSGFLQFSLHDSSLASQQIVPFGYPTFKQCDTRWGNHTIETTTVCAVGCLMSSISMALAGHGIDVGSAPADPGSLNDWLRANGGYDGENDLQEDKIANVSTLLPVGAVQWPADGMHKTNDLTFEIVQQYLAQKPPRVVIANVLHGRHFVLVIGTVGADTILVNDPGFTTTNYSYSGDVVGWRIFDMTL
eukprot:TRINITY_DN38391_c0_g1_i2.p1 TRINITY_DN38391_c0_g1~~TRINITY_DN38391_c0_g1_i2.p1  ORF type:complete len:223 (+),score=32.71 TRINITY_DN38391_c0_g1_i2:114-782(+)